MMQEPTTDKPIIALSSRIAYENPWMKVREDKTLRAGGVEGMYGVVETNDSIIIAPINDKNEVYVTYSYSYPTDTWSWLLPGGGGDGEESEVAARRELLEETGITAGHVEILGNLMVSQGLMKEQMAVAVATDLTYGERAESADDLDTVGKGKFVSFDELHRMVMAGEMRGGQAIAALYLVERWLEAGKS